MSGLSPRQHRHDFARLAPTALCLLMVAATWAPVVFAQAPIASPPASAVQQATSSGPVLFEKNMGQWDPQALFRIHTKAYEAYVTKTGLTMVQTQASNSTNTTSAWATTMTLVGGNPTPVVTTNVESAYHTNYFIGNDPLKWHANVPHFSQVTLHNVYPGIDLVYHGNSSSGDLKYDFLVHAGFDASVIQQRFNGTNQVYLDASGELVIDTGLGSIRQGLPVTKQANGVSVTNNYVVSNETVSFNVGSHDLAQDLIIDPLVYSTYISGGGSELKGGIAVDASGNTYVSGYAQASGYPTTTGAYKTSFSGDADAVVTKINPSGSGLVYSTYLGGSLWDVGYGMTADASGNVYVTGNAYSTNFPVTSGAFRTWNAGGQGSDVFVTKLNPTGSALLYSTYVGGTGYDRGSSIAVDASGNAYVTGFLGSTDYPFTSGVFQTTNRGGTESFVTKLNPAGTGLSYSSYLGGGGEDYGSGIAVDGSGNAYVSGQSTSTNYPVTSGVIQATNAGGWDIVAAKVNPTASALSYATYIGGTGDDSGPGGNGGRAIAVDANGNVYITGTSGSTNYPVNSGAYQVGNAGGSDVVVTKLNSDATSRLYSTYLGGSASDSGNSISVDASGFAYITGSTSSANYPVASAIQTTNAGYQDAFITRLETSGSPVMSTYLGGSHSETSYNIAVDSSGNSYITGSTYSSNYPTTSGAYQTSGANNFLSKVSPSSAPAPGAPTSLSASCASPHGTVLSWGPPSSGPTPTGYNVYRSGDGITYTFVASPSASPYTDVPAWRSTYTYRIMAVNSGIEGPPATLSFAPCDSQALTVSGNPQTYTWRNTMSGLGGITWQDTYSGLAATQQYSVGTTSGGTDILTWTLMPVQPTSGQTTPWSPTLTPASLAQGTNYVNTRITDRAGNILVTNGAWTIQYDNVADTIATLDAKDSCAGSSLSTTMWQNDNTPCYAWSTPTSTSPIAGYSYTLGIATSTPLNENFNVGVGWTTTGFWHVTARRAYSLPNSMWYGRDATGTYDNGATNSGTATSPSFQVPTSSTLTFKSWYRTEAGTTFDQKLVEISTNGGSSWATLMQVSDTQSQWNSESASLGAYAGQNALLRFRFNTVDASSNAYEGWYVDDVVVGSTGNPNPDATIDTAATTLDRAGSALADGTWQFRVASIDQAGNLGVIKGPLNLMVDATAPTGPGTPVVINARSTPTLATACLQDVTSGLAATVAYWIGSTAGASDYLPLTALPVQPPSGQTTTFCPSFQVAGPVWHEGNNYVTMRVADRAGNSADLVTHLVIWDTVPDPTTGLAVKASCSGAALPLATWQADNTPAFSWNAATSTSAIVGYSYTLAGSPVAPDSTVDTTSTCLAPGTVADGSWHFEVSAKDAAGNLGPAAGPANLLIDATAPSIPSVSTSTHPDTARYYGRATAVFSWSATDASSGIAGYYYQTLTTSCPASLASTGTYVGSSTTTASSTPGVFGTFQFCVQARDNAGNLGSVAAYPFNIDTVKPDFLFVQPSPGATSPNPRETVRASFDDADGGLDPAFLGPQKTIVDVSNVKFFVDGVDLIATWGPACGPGQPLQLAGACDLQVDSGQVSFTPLVPWLDGLHSIFVQVQDTVVDANRNNVTWSFTVNTGSIVDADGDRVPDAVESELCSDSTALMLIGMTSQLGHHCNGGSDYVPPDQNVTLFLPTNAQVGPDADQDGFPATVTLQGMSVKVTPFTPSFVTVGPALDMVVTVDSDDGNASVPVQDRFTVPASIPVGLQPGPDADRDGIPETVAVVMAEVTFDRSQPTNPVTFTPTPGIVIPLDRDDAAVTGDDSNPEVPVPNHVTIPLLVPTGFDFGPDGDRDGVPSTLIVHQQRPSIDRANGGITWEQVPDNVVDVDRADSEPNIPVQSIVVVPIGIPTGISLGPDADGDGVPASVIVHESQVTIDRRDGANAIHFTAAPDLVEPVDPNDNDPASPAGSRFGPVSIPVGAGHSGDGDDDGVPASVTVDYLDVTIDRTQPNPLILAGHGQTTSLDDDGAYGNPIPWSAIDADHDHLPDAVETVLCLVETPGDDSDGYCVGADDYRAPIGVPNPWNL